VLKDLSVCLLIVPKPNSWMWTDFVTANTATLGTGSYKQLNKQTGCRICRIHQL